MSGFFTKDGTPTRGIKRSLAIAADGTLVIPANAAVTKIHVRNKTANAVTGGVKVGTTAGGTDVLAAGAVAASAVTSFTPLIPAVNTAGTRTLYIAAVTAWNSAVLDVAVEFDELV